jgi:predicted nucleic acid-binding protein
VLAEFYAIVTNARRVTDPRPPQEVLDAIDRILAMPGMTLLPAPVDLVNRWTALVRAQPVTGSKVFDAQLVATMQGNGIRRIYTFNGPDFEKFPDIEVVTPS